ncbi:MAG: thiol-disulfide oxidoreductase DCC family protein [Porticoccaceae bacterium]
MRINGVENAQIDTLFFDGQCPLCRREINLLQRLSDEGLAFMDIHQIVPEPQFPSAMAMLRVLHLRKACGSWLTGVDATVHAWSHTRWGWLFKPLRWSLWAPWIDRRYSRWAQRRYNRLYHCNRCMGGED